MKRSRFTLLALAIILMLCSSVSISSAAEPSLLSSVEKPLMLRLGGPASAMFKSVESNYFHAGFDWVTPIDKDVASSRKSAAYLQCRVGRFFMSSFANQTDRVFASLDYQPWAAHFSYWDIGAYVGTQSRSGYDTVEPWEAHIGFNFGISGYVDGIRQDILHLDDGSMTVVSSFDEKNTNTCVRMNFVEASTFLSLILQTEVNYHHQLNLVDRYKGGVGIMFLPFRRFSDAGKLWDVRHLYVMPVIYKEDIRDAEGQLQKNSYFGMTIGTYFPLPMGKI